MLSNTGRSSLAIVAFLSIPLVAAAQTPQPPTVFPAAAPAVVNRGDSVLLTIAVGTDRPAAFFSAVADLRAVGGEEGVAFNDAGFDGDVVANDRVLSRRITVPGTAPFGAWRLPVAVGYDYGIDGAGSLATSISLTVGTPLPVTGAVEPATVLRGQSVLVTAHVPRRPGSAGTIVETDTGHIGHNTVVPLLDDGTTGDLVAGDRVFSRRVAIRADAPEGATELRVIAFDAFGGGSVSLPLTITAPPSPPAVTVTITPDPATPHVMVSITVSVTPGSGPPSTGLLATIDLSPLGLSSRAILANDSFAVVPAGEQTFWANVLVPRGAPAEPMALTGQVSDAQGRVVPFTASLTIAASPDLDSDGLADACETLFGLSPLSGVGADGASGDPDGDGLTNAQECAADSHPRGSFRRYLAEGAANDFFRTRLALFNPSDAASHALVRVQPEGRPEQRVGVVVPPWGVRQLTAAELRILVEGPFSTLVESDRLLVVDRTMTWGDGEYGGHVETAASAPSTTWYFAEGATGWRFSLFYLLQNPGDTAAEVVVHYLRAPGEPPLSRTYVVPPRSRRTIPVDDEEFPAGSGQRPLGSGDVAARIEVTNGVPIVAERAMYLSPDGQPFGAGHGAMGATAPATRWTFAEGATGSYFDEYLLLANPGSTPATVQVTLHPTDAGGPRVSEWVVPANSRRTIHVDALLGLDCCSVAAEVLSDAPVVAERVMWWPGTAEQWREGHVSLGSTVTAPKWAIAGLEQGGPLAMQSFVLVSGSGATVRAYRPSDPTPIVCALPAPGRQTLWLATCQAIAGERVVGVVVEGAADTTVEWSTYSGIGGGAGGAALAVPIP